MLVESEADALVLSLIEADAVSLTLVDNDSDTEDYEDANDDTEDDVEIDDYKDSTSNKWKSAAAGILMVGIPAAGFLYWLVSNGIL